MKTEYENILHLEPLRRLFAGTLLAIALAGCSGDDGKPGPPGEPGPSVPIIQTLATDGNPARPGGSVTLNASVQSAQSSALTYSWSVPSGWTIVSGAATPTLVVTAPASYAQSGTATLTVTDAQNRSAVGTIVLATVVNEAPVIHEITVPMPERRGGVFNVTATTTDPNGNTLQLT